MVNTSSVINAYNEVLCSVGPFTGRVLPFDEDFAIKRFFKKFQVPDKSVTLELRNRCISDYKARDLRLPENRTTLYPKEWYQARSLIESWLETYRDGDFSFPQGSEFTPTHGLNSVESRLSRSDWTCTPDNFTAFAKTVYRHRALKVAAKKRFTRLLHMKGFHEQSRIINSKLYRRYNGYKNPAFVIFMKKLAAVCTFVQGSRFSSVEKNNDSRRPISIEPFANIVTQSQIGKGIRNVLNTIGIDLNTLQDTHRRLISSQGVSTIDLSNASDSISVDLCRFLLPSWFFNKLNNARSRVIEFDDDVLYLKKISSMGNGFTFELMTLILTAISRTLDPSASVYGDDIIISDDHSHRLIFLLEDVGLVINREKSFIKSKFRESCGGNYHDDFGYIKSFDFKYNVNIHDCVMTLNKCYYLRSYPFFNDLYNRLLEVTPDLLHGGPFDMSDNILDIRSDHSVTGYDFPDFFITPQAQPIGKALANKIAGEYHFVPSGIAYAYKFVTKSHSKRLSSLTSGHWAKYYMYLHAGRRCDDLKVGIGHWVTYRVIKDQGRFIRP